MNGIPNTKNDIKVQNENGNAKKLSPFLQNHEQHPPMCSHIFSHPLQILLQHLPQHFSIPVQMVLQHLDIP